MSFTYAPLSPEHADAWHALRVEGARDFPLGFLVSLAETEVTTPEQTRKILANGTVRGVFDQDKLVGFCGYRPQQLERTRHRAEIGPFFVTASAQGSGAAQAMMDGVITEARAAGLAQLELFVDIENTRALRFYERHGFKVVATHPDGVRIDGVSRDDHFCILRLS